ncbi:Peptidase family M28 [Planctomycetes bacterium Poly30]|uniref:Peptidase family M28 n=1 Tax=Saltatorellus ferox TaxID=2528018 RepID=A0A518EQI1_9BACT|nr:Peptidase family M28 [Planctomycetes bacterium Poly30]
MIYPTQKIVRIAFLALPIALFCPGGAAQAPGSSSELSLLPKSSRTTIGPFPGASIGGRDHSGPAVAPPITVAGRPLPDELEDPSAGAPAGEVAGPARFTGLVYDAFDVGTALEDTLFIDGFYRTPGSPLYDAVIDRLHARLEAAGFGISDRLTLKIVETDMGRPAWWPLGGSLTLDSAAGSELLLAFGSPGDAHRTMLPVGAPEADVEGPVALSLKDVTPGSVLATRAPLSGQLVGKAASRGAVCVLSSALFPFTIDPTGADRHLDAIRFETAPRGATIAVGKISPRILDRIEAAKAADDASTLRFIAKTKTAQRPLRTLIAEILGEETPGEAVAIASHLQEPGAGDNAAGAAGLCSAAVAIATLMDERKIAPPSRTLAFVFGNEMEQSRIWLEATDRKTIAALSADMLGQSPERTGAVALLERTPDPGALYTILPDEHTPWGAGRVSEEDMRPNGVNVICREALIDVAAHVGGWHTSENPWEGGSDHDVFNDATIPAALMWHFTDFTYHTSLDRMGMIDARELHNTCTAIVSAGLALADLRPADVPRHLASNELERKLRKEAAATDKNTAAAAAWDRWCDGVNEWFAPFAK